MAIFDKVFQIKDTESIAKIGRTTLDSTAESIDTAFENTNEYDDVKTLRDEMRNDGLDVDGRMLSAGSMGIIFRTTSTKSGKPIESAITRIENVGTPLNHPIVLKPVYEKKFKVEEDFPDGKYQVYIVPYAPDIEHPDQPDKKVTSQDIINTIRVLKATGHENHLIDLSLDNFVFLKDDNGEVMRYPASTLDSDLRGQPIAFVRDLNACPDSEKIAHALRPMGNPEEKLQEMGIALKDIEPAPQDCVNTCKRQYSYTARLADALQAEGIEPNIPLLPEVLAIKGAWTTQNPPGTKLTRKINSVN